MVSWEECISTVEYAMKGVFEVKKLLILTLVCALLVSTSICTASAAEHEHNHPDEPVMLEKQNTAEILPRVDGFCTDCYYETGGQMYYWYSVCAQEGILSDSWTHRTLLGNECRVTLLISNGAVMCERCASVREFLGYHDCWEVHTECYLGQNNLCTMDIS